MEKTFAIDPAGLALAPDTDVMEKSSDYLPGEWALTRGTEITVGCLIGAMTVVIWMSVFTRYVVENPLPWAEQVAKYLMIWAAMVGSSLAMRKGAHVAVDLVVTMLPRRAADVAHWVGAILTGGFLLMIVIYGIQFCMAVRLHSDPVVGELSMAVPYAAIPAGAFLALIQLAYIARHGRTENTEAISLL